MPEPTDPRATQIRAVYVISVAAELAGVHPQTLRIYERKGLVDPARVLYVGNSTMNGDFNSADLEKAETAVEFSFAERVTAAAPVSRSSGKRFICRASARTQRSCTCRRCSHCGK